VAARLEQELTVDRNFKLMGKNGDRNPLGTSNPPPQLIVPFLQLDPTAVIICGCQPPGHLLVLRSLTAPVQCPNCQRRYGIDKIAFDAQESYRKTGTPGDAKPTVNFTMMEPLIMRPTS
jgi:hypothetical protein